MIRLDELSQGRDGTRWRRARSCALMKASTFPRPGEVYYGLGPQKNAPGFMYIEHEGYARSVPESFVDRVEFDATHFVRGELDAAGPSRSQRDEG